MPDARIGVVGATGAVGTVTLALLAERGYEHVRAFASARSAGTEFTYLDGKLTVEEATPETLADADVDLLLFSVGTDASRELVPPGSRKRDDLHRQVGRVPAHGRDPARRRRRERRDDRRRPHRREPELLGDPAHLRPQAAARRGRPRARASRDLPVDVGRRRRGHRAPPLREADGGRPGDGLGVHGRRVERGVEAPRRDAEDPVAPGSCAPGDLRPDPRARRPRAGGLGRDRGAALGRAGDRDPRRRSARRAGRPPDARATPPGATRCSSPGSVPTRRPTAGSRSGS